MHLCLTVECIAASLQFLQHCLSFFAIIQSNQLIRSHPLTAGPRPRCAWTNRQKARRADLREQPQ